MKEKIRLLKNIRLFDMLNDAQLEVLAKYSSMNLYKKDDIIFSEGGPGDEIYIIKNGEVSILKNYAQNEENELANLIKGDYFGEMDIFDSSLRTVTAKAIKDSEILQFPDSETPLKNFFDTHADISALFLYKMMAIIAGRIRSANKLISEKTPWVEDLRKQLLMDKLTGLYNIIFLEEELPQKLAGFGKNTSLLIIKPDNFKEINDSFGHEVGDNALVFLAKTIKDNIDINYLAARYKGDVFSIILPDSGIETSKGFAVGLCKKIYSLDILELTKKSFYIPVSIGISLYPNDTTDSNKLIEIAYNRMMTAREGGGNRVCGP
jgi:diguanylate cyclase (GGDEF)-like protein